MPIAFTRAISPQMGKCELTYMPRQTIDIGLAKLQHKRYEEGLRALGCSLRSFPPEPDLPDSVFVEDTAIVFDEIGILSRPGAVSRRPETASAAKVLSEYRTMMPLRAPGTLDGGDVLRIGRNVFIGASTRTNMPAIDQVREILEPYGYAVKAVPVIGSLHLKTAATLIADGLVLLNREWIDSRCLTGAQFVDVDPAEPFGGNGIAIGENLLYPSNFPRTRQKIEALGIRIYPVDMSEVIKAEGAVTCCSILIRES